MLKLYSKTNCPMCEFATRRLNEAGVDYKKITDIDTMLSIGIRSVPVIELENGNLLSGKAMVSYLNTLKKE